MNVTVDNGKVCVNVKVGSLPVCPFNVGYDPCVYAAVATLSGECGINTRKQTAKISPETATRLLSVFTPGQLQTTTAYDHL